MRRMVILSAILSVIASGVGCKVITGQEDCTYDPSAVGFPPTDNGGRPPYPVVGPPVGGVGIPAAPVPILPATPMKVNEK